MHICLIIAYFKRFYNKNSLLLREFLLFITLSYEMLSEDFFQIWGKYQKLPLYGAFHNSRFYWYKILGLVF
ncbi:MAG: hypothetical protein A3C58_03785 [Candidatus Staskawiczbacteria bacterium RIFCSPHIGHO2_02_FULL_34_10]|uniref:Uncharacterized protein n=1 Tax=Candidatus Staskawiczbacteria bacterium RIFCSPHIGHO2_02_FULL_34_10 TaxID=1802205 RepID=A0A1G2HY25_9BACT|nr:MAG: hypothetical protein A3C58_03785 [Candidatus Staskawiczbacteria bacterium RIFCSPHIGHO2_02_FULL_34_10]